MTRPLRTSWIVAAGGALALAACGGDTTEEPDAGTDTSLPDVVVNDTAPDGAETGTCESGVTCTRGADCAEAGIEGGQCIAGCCEAGTTLPTCATHLSECTEDSQSNLDFVCDTTGGVCLARCDFAGAADTQSADCPLNSYCLSELQNVTDGGLEGVCLPGDCDTNLFDDAACGGTGTCLPVGNGASFCIDGGTAAVGDACNAVETEPQPASDICSPGLLCFEGECIQPCNRRDAAAGCDEGETCLAAFDTTPRNQPGLCGTGCEAFSTGTCGDDVCGPVLGRFGINVWACLDGADATGEEGDDCTDVPCREGLICLGQGEGEPPLCTDMCDPLGSVGSAGSGCDAASSVEGAEVIGATAFGEASDYVAAAAGEYSHQLRAVGGGLLAPATFTVAASTVTTTVYTLIDGALGSYELEDFLLGDTLPAAGYRIVHGASGAPTVDVVVQQSLTVATGGVGTREVAAGEVTLDDASSEIAVGAGETALFVRFDGDNVSTDNISAADVPAGANTAGLLAFHGVPGGPNVDVYAGCALGEVTACAEDNLLFANLGAGEFSDAFAAVPTAAAGATVFVVVAGTNPAEAQASDIVVAATIPTLADDGLYAAVVWLMGDTPAVAFVGVPSAPAGRGVVALVNTEATAATLDIGAVVATDVAFGEATDGSTSAYSAAAPGAYEAVLVIDGADPVVGAFSVTSAGLVSVIFDGTAFQSFADAVAPPADGQGWYRIAHLATGAPAVRVTAAGEADLTCVPSRLSGFGFCQESCAPYPRRPGSYDCEGENQTCFPFVARDDRPSPIQGACDDAGTGTVGAGGTCDDPGSLGGQCLDFAVCLSETEEDTEGQCHPLCEPFTTGQCSGYPNGLTTCSGIPPLVGSLNLSFCLEAQAGTIGGRCTEEGLPCAADSSICLDFGDGPVCNAVCREGFDDCAGVPGTRCVTGQLNPDVVPTFMGLCQ